MNLIIFPIIFVYFMIGWFFSKCIDDGLHDDAETVMHFLFWPVIFAFRVCFCISVIVVYIFKKVLIITRNIYRLIRKSIINKRRITF